MASHVILVLHQQHLPRHGCCLRAPSVRGPATTREPAVELSRGMCGRECVNLGAKRIFGQVQIKFFKFPYSLYHAVFTHTHCAEDTFSALSLNPK